MSEAQTYMTSAAPEFAGGASLKDMLATYDRLYLATQCSRRDGNAAMLACFYKKGAAPEWTTRIDKIEIHVSRWAIKGRPMPMSLVEEDVDGLRIATLIIHPEDFRILKQSLDEIDHKRSPEIERYMALVGLRGLDRSEVLEL